MRDSAGYETIVFERRRPVGLLTLDRPERLDAINRQMIDELNRCPDAAERDVDMRALVLAGAARTAALMRSRWGRARCAIRSCT